MAFPRLTREEWREEVELALAGSRSRWGVTKPIVEQSSPLCHADLANTVAGKVRAVIVARDRFATADARIAEITRQIHSGVEQWGDSPRSGPPGRDRPRGDREER